MPYRVKHGYRKSKRHSKMPKALQKKLVKKVVNKVMNKAETYRNQTFKTEYIADYEPATFLQTGVDLTANLRSGTLTAWGTAGALNEKMRGWEIFMKGLQIRGSLVGAVGTAGNPPFCSAMTRIIIVIDKQPADVAVGTGNPNLTLYDDALLPAGAWNHCILQNKTFNSPIVKEGKHRFTVLYDRTYKTCNLRQNILPLNIYKKLNKKFAFYPTTNNLTEQMPPLDKKILMFALSSVDNTTTDAPQIEFISTLYYKDF